jgi:hypothetical protein
MKTILFAFALVCLAAVSTAQAQTPPWSGIIDSNRAINWNPGVPGGIPSATWTQCGSTVSPYGTSSSPGVSHTISALLAACGPNTYVLLGPGSFYLNGSIYIKAQSRVELRGSGGNVANGGTKIYFYGSNDTVNGDNCDGLYSVLCIESGDVNDNVTPSNTANWTAGYSQGTTVITLSAVSNLKIGNPIILDELKTTADTGAIIENDSTSGSNPFTSPGTPGPYSYAGGQVRAGRGLTHTYTVSGCDGSTTVGHQCVSTNVTIYPPIEENYWDSTLSPAAWWATSPAQYDGFQNLSFDATNNGCTVGNSPLIGFFNAVDSWSRGIASFNGCEAHVAMRFSAQLIIRDSYMMLARDSTSTSYGVECFASSDNLIENNIFQAIAGPLIFQEGCTANVKTYNFAINDYYSVPGYGLAMAQTHGLGADLDYMEGNEGMAIQGDAAHGAHLFNTWFRNYLSGTNVVCFLSTTGGGNDYATYLATTWGSCTNAIRAVEDDSYGRFFNVVGNVLGTAGVTTSYLNGSNPIYDVGQGQSGDGVTVGSDATVLQTLYRWGNVDATNGGAGGTPFTVPQWNSSEVPTTGTLATSQQPWAQTVPSSHALPASFIYPSQPSWWPAGKPWPIIGPDVTGGNVSGVNGTVYTNPAEDCYLSLTGATTNGTGGPFPFDANACYGASSGSVSLSPSSESFGSINLGSSSLPVTFTLTNNSSTTATSIAPSTVHNTVYVVTNSGAGSCAAAGGSLAASASCTFTVMFTPAVAGLITDTLSVSYGGGDGAGPQTSALSGTGASRSSSVAPPTNLHAVSIN